MNTHPDVETLSIYLDSRLSRLERSRVDEHLERCGDCRERLCSLEKVVEDLRSLERMAPPPHLGTHLHRLAALQASEPTLIQRLEHSVSRFNVHSTIAPVFAVVVALIVIIYMLSWGLHRQATGRIPVHLEPEETVIDTLAVESSRQVAGRTFALDDGVWIERGLEDLPPIQILSGTDPQVQSWMADTPALATIATLGQRVRVVMNGSVVEIRFETP